MSDTVRPASFDPSSAASAGSGIFGLTHSPDQAHVHVIPVPFDATTSYRKGAARGPAAILRASHQVDLRDLLFGDAFSRGICMLPEDPRIAAWNAEATRLAQPIIDLGGEIGERSDLRIDLARVNRICAELDEWAARETRGVFQAGRLPIVVGGDHAVPLGAIREAAAAHPGVGVLHFDAHADLRLAYEGFERSHASILRNVLDEVEGVSHVVQVGIRDVCEEEMDYAAAQAGRLTQVPDHEWAFHKLEGKNLRARARQAINKLPQSVWVTFDIDGLDPALCPNTGTPVPGGLSFQEASLWFHELIQSGRRIIGADLVEVSPGDGSEDEDTIDAQVGARVLYRLIGAALASDH